MKDYGLEGEESAGELEQIRPNLPAPVHGPTESEIDVQIRTARANPRDIRKAFADSIALVSEPGIAEKCSYALERWDKRAKRMVKIEGPSIRLAEIAAYSWGNIGMAGNIIEIGPTEVIAEGLAIDLERNTRVRIVERRSVVGRNGQRYSQEMCEITAKVAQAIAMRNAILKVIPGAFINRLLEHAKSIAAAGPMEPKVAAMFEWAAGEGITEKEILAYLGLGSRSDIDQAALNKLRGVAGAIREGLTTADDVFRKPQEEKKRDDAEKVSRPAPKKPAAQVATAPPAAAEGSGKAQEAPAPAQLIPESAITSAAREFAKQRLGPKLFSMAWEHIENAVSDDEGVRYICSAPKTILEAACSEADPVAAVREIADTAARVQR